MAETLASLHDKLSIANIRLKTLYAKISAGVPVLEAERLTELASLVRRQRDELDREIHEYMASALYGSKLMKIEEPKYKIYQGENSSGVGFDDLKDAIFHLAKMNQTLWDLEDGRRDKSKSDAEVRAICDDVAKFNRLRNDTMDEINRLFNEEVQTRKGQQ